MDSLFNIDTSGALIMGVGALGCAAAKCGAEHGDESSGCWSAAHVASSELIATGLERKLFLRGGSGPFAERIVSRSVEDNAGLIERFAAGKDAAVLCGELSDPTAMLLMGALGHTLGELGLAVFALAIEPFAIGAGVDAESLDARRDELAGRLPFAALLNPGMENMSAGVSVKRVQTLAADRLARAAECLAWALDSANHGVMGLRTLRGIHHAVMGAAGDGSSETSSLAIEACDRALVAFDDPAWSRINAAIVRCSSDLSLRESRVIGQKIPARAFLIAGLNPAFEGHSECLILCGAEKSENVVSIDSLRNCTKNAVLV